MKPLHHRLSCFALLALGLGAGQLRVAGADASGANDATNAPVESSQAVAGRVTVLEPAYRATVKGDTVVKVVAPGLTQILATCWKNGGTYGKDSDITPRPVPLDAGGLGSFTFPADQYPHGPITVTLKGTAGAGGKSDTCYLQLFNTGGTAAHAGLKNLPAPPQTKGMALTYSDDFDTMPTISRTGAGATYCSLKPDGGEFGDAVFADREGPYDPFYQTETYLRMRMTYRPDFVDPRGWKRHATTGFISSEREDGTGFHTKGGHDQYFEARLLYGAAPGTWPAFWTLSSMNYQGSPGPCDELDILESYMPWTRSYHITPHEWSYVGGKAKGEHVVDVTQIGGHADLCQTFHTYGCLIQHDVTTYYFDNVEVYQHPTLKYSWEQGNYFMINLAFQDRKDAYVNGDFRRYGGEDDLWADWVRVYEKK